MVSRLGPRMPPDLISGRDIELIAVGLLSLLASGWWATSPDGAVNVTPMGLFLGLSVVGHPVARQSLEARPDPRPARAGVTGTESSTPPAFRWERATGGASVRTGRCRGAGGTGNGPSREGPTAPGRRFTRTSDARTADRPATDRPLSLPRGWRGDSIRYHTTNRPALCSPYAQLLRVAI
jgi:hypothetical protein